MSIYLNEWDIANIVDDLRDRDDLPNLRRAAATLDRLRVWTDRNSDGWPYWRAPRNASQKLAQALQAWTESNRRGYGDTDLSDANLRKILTPVKSFLTRHGADHSLVIHTDREV